MTAATYDVLGIGNAIVDILAKTEDRFLTEQGWTQGELAQALHVDPKTVSRWMTGGITPSGRRLDEG